MENSQTTSSTNAQPFTVFDLLYAEYFPFRLYADYMLGKSVAALSQQFGLSESWVAERIEALHLCLSKQVRLNLLETAQPNATIH